MDARTHTPPAMRSLHVLIAEPDDFMARLLERLLANEGHRTSRATDGHQALALAMQGGFDLLLLDVEHQGFDGFALVGELRQQEAGGGKHLPVIALTSDPQNADRQRYLTAGMDDRLSRPIQVTALRDAIGRAMATSPAPAPPHSDLIDYTVFLAASGGDQKHLADLCQVFLQGLPEYLSEVRDSFASGDASKLKRSAHRLAGMISAASTKAAAVASQIENRAGVARLDEILPLIEQLTVMVEAIVADIKTLSAQVLGLSRH
ncbi:MAG TPA: response regulator [Tepidisphaeraceae bacterium]|nr:response regulator [Tepidisphaeraceae bacterium]